MLGFIGSAGTAALIMREESRVQGRLAFFAAVGMAILTWAFLVSDIYSHVTFKVLPPPPTVGAAAMSGLIQGFGACSTQVDGTKLAAWEGKYEVGLICGVNDAATDRYQAEGISVSSLHAIRPEPVAISASRSPAMSTAIKKIAQDVTKNMVKPPPPARVRLIFLFGMRSFCSRPVSICQKSIA